LDSAAGRGRGVRVDEGEAAIDGRIGPQRRQQLSAATGGEHRFPEWQALLVPGCKVLGEQDSAVYEQEPQVAPGFGRIGRWRRRALRNLPADVILRNVDNALRDDLGGTAGRRWLIGHLQERGRELRRTETEGKRGNRQDRTAPEHELSDSPR
jgi:hypothetical protein